MQKETLRLEFEIGSLHHKRLLGRTRLLIRVLKADFAVVFRLKYLYR